MSDPSPTRYRVSVSAIVGKRQRGGADVSKSLRFLDGLRERCRAIRYLATDHLQSHNLKVPGSNPGPATTHKNAGSPTEPAFFVLRSVASAKVIILGRCEEELRGVLLDLQSKIEDAARRVEPISQYQRNLALTESTSTAMVKEI
jgi:hypothetical protein